MDKRSFFFVPKLDADGDLLCRLLGIAEPPCPIEILQSFPTCSPPPNTHIAVSFVRRHCSCCITRTIVLYLFVDLAFSL